MPSARQRPGDHRRGARRSLRPSAAADLASPTLLGWLGFRQGVNRRPFISRHLSIKPLDYLVLPPQNLVYQHRIVFLVYEQFRHDLRVEIIDNFCAGNDQPYRNILMVIQQIFYQKRFSRVTSPYQYYYGSFVFICVEGNPSHIEFL
jgi:hypothetical protein